MATTRSWKCRGCGKSWTNTRLKKCPFCGRAKPKKRRPAHMSALDLPYEVYVEINGGEFCAICGKRPKRDAAGNVIRRLDRDHDHVSGKPRGLLCPGRMGCNRKLGRVDDLAWLRAANRYLTSAEERRRAAGL